jgi:alpha-D-xyloside xylohydrolase
MPAFRQEHNALLWEQDQETLCVQAWGNDSLRIRSSARSKIRDDLPGALLEPSATEAKIEITEHHARIRNGAIAAEIQLADPFPPHDNALASMRFLDVAQDKELLAEKSSASNGLTARKYTSLGEDRFKIELQFKGYNDERIYGLGQHQHNRLDQKGLEINLLQRNSQVSIPFLLSSRGYGLLWNNPSIGRVELKEDHTRWIAESTQQIDYWITCGATPATILENYADATGHAPMLPGWALGFWQSKLRYRTQEELLAVAREYKRRGLPLSVIVIDALHWTTHGDYQFDLRDWPHPGEMIRELEGMGITVLVSIWPTINPLSPNYQEMLKRGLLVQTVPPGQAVTRSIDKRPDGYVDLHLYDATHPEARSFLWDQVSQGYYDLGIKHFWLDACEPEMTLLEPDDVIYHAGDGKAVTNIYPLMHAHTFYEGMRAHGEKAILNLCRSAWAGSQRYAAAVWSGDVPSTFEALQAQVRAGLNIGLSGIPWWTTDIGGFSDEDPSSAYFQELIVRWFQYGTFCPLFRLHGYRKPYSDPDSAAITGGPNEVWSFGEKAYAIIRELLFLRERLRPYLLQQMRIAHERGIPPMRPLFFDFPHDSKGIHVDDQFMLGPDILVAPVLETGVSKREVYLPHDTHWIDAWTDDILEGGQWVNADAPLEWIPVYFREGARIDLNCIR